MPREHLNENAFAVKLAIRQAACDLGRDGGVLDCCAAQGKLWSAVKTNRQITSVELRKGVNAKAIEADSIKMIRRLNLGHFAIVDIDTFGTPIGHMLALQDRSYSGIVLYTHGIRPIGTMHESTHEAFGTAWMKDVAPKNVVRLIEPSFIKTLGATAEWTATANDVIMNYGIVGDLQFVAEVAKVVNETIGGTQNVRYEDSMG